MRTLVLGGARSGKSAFAEELAGRDRAVRYVATAVLDPDDAEFADRIAAHRDRRPARWSVVEGDPVDVLTIPAPITLIDDLGTWLTARLDARSAWDSPRGTITPDIDALIAAVAAYSDRLLIVSPEVGLGIIPATRSGRLFQDELGKLNQRLAALCDEVLFIVAGRAIPLQPPTAPEQPASTTGVAGQLTEPAASNETGSAAATIAKPGVGSTTAPAITDSVVGESAAAASLSAGDEAGSAPTDAVAASAGPSAPAETSVGGETGSAAGSAADLGGGVGSSAAAVVAGAAGVGRVVAGVGDETGSAGVVVDAGVGGSAVGDDVSGRGGVGDNGVGRGVVGVEGFGGVPVFGAVAEPDRRVWGVAEERQLRLTKPAGALGRLEALGNWVAACQGVCPPRQFERARVVVFAGDHGVARQGVSAYPAEVTAQMVANFVAGGAAVNTLARLADATVRVVDIAVDGDTDPAVSGYKVRRASGSIDREDALSEAEVHTALAVGRAIADEEIDAGADLLIAGDMGIGNTTPATVLIATLTDTEPVLAMGRGTGVDDAGWMRKAAVVRDAMWRARPHRHDPVALLRTVGGADFAAVTGYLAQAAARRTPVILDGVVITAAAVLAEMLAPGAKAWWVAGHRSTEPAHQLALTKLGLEPLLDMSMRLGEGSGALTALPVLRAAVGALGEMSTFDEAGVSTADAAH
ncbi:nicotinate-nucleotide--dimethylbenzimidazole phosphoribosyltransferase [Nocardia terpenica]|nr:nicotinate-nucleotide--dimethylbenzimidazole phosphoribosyltransferase [Nocardia terpenica]